MLRSRRFHVALVAALLVAAAPGCVRKYAVLVSTNQVIHDDVQIHSEWWYDLVLQYRMLREAGFEDENIVVLYGDGIDFATAHSAYDAKALFGHAITTMAVSKANVQKAFEGLRPKVGKKDHLYVWWMGHGSGGGADGCALTMSISNTGESVTDAEFASYLAAVGTYRKRSINVMTCHSGGLLGEFAAAGNRTVLLTSSSCWQYSYDADRTCTGVFHAEFNYANPNGLRRKDPCGAPVASDANGDGVVSWRSAYQYDLATMVSSTPQVADPDGIAASTAVAKKDP